MWESIAQLGMNPLTLVFGVIVILLLVVMVKKGTLRYKGHGVQIGADEKERLIIRSEFEYTDSFFEQYITDPMFKDVDEFKLKHISDKCKDVVEKAILFNSMTTDGSYIRTKCDLIYAAILKRSSSSMVREEAFREKVYTEGERLFKSLIDIRRSYK